jgi:hypothetical protein
MSDSGYIKAQNEAPTAKITITVEEGDEVRTMTIHKAYNVVTHINHRDIFTQLPKPGALPMTPSKIDFIFEGSAIFNEETHNFMEAKLEKKDE